MKKEPLLQLNESMHAYERIAGSGTQVGFSVQYHSGICETCRIWQKTTNAYDTPFGPDWLPTLPGCKQRTLQINTHF